jgi:hypothetical protein
MFSYGAAQKQGRRSLRQGVRTTDSKLTNLPKNDDNNELIAKPSQKTKKRKHTILGDPNSNGLIIQGTQSSHISNGIDTTGREEPDWPISFSGYGRPAFKTPLRIPVIDGHLSLLGNLSVRNNVSIDGSLTVAGVNLGLPTTMQESYIASTSPQITLNGIQGEITMNSSALIYQDPLLTIEGTVAHSLAVRKDEVDLCGSVLVTDDGISGALTVNGGVLTEFNDTTASTGVGVGSVKFDGGISVALESSFGAHINHTGDLLHAGTNTGIVSGDVIIDDTKKLETNTIEPKTITNDATIMSTLDSTANINIGPNNGATQITLTPTKDAGVGTDGSFLVKGGMTVNKKMYAKSHFNAVGTITAQGNFRSNNYSGDNVGDTVSLIDTTTTGDINIGSALTTGVITLGGDTTSTHDIDAALFRSNTFSSTGDTFMSFGGPTTADVSIGNTCTTGQVLIGASLEGRSDITLQGTGGIVTIGDRSIVDNTHLEMFHADGTHSFHIRPVKTNPDYHGDLQLSGTTESRFFIGTGVTTGSVWIGKDLENLGFIYIGDTVNTDDNNRGLTQVFTDLQVMGTTTFTGDYEGKIRYHQQFQNWETGTPTYLVITTTAQYLSIPTSVITTLLSTDVVEINAQFSFISSSASADVALITCTLERYKNIKDSISAISAVGATVTITTGVAHGLTSGDLVSVKSTGVHDVSVVEDGITVTSTTQFTYVADQSAGTPSLANILTFHTKEEVQVMGQNADTDSATWGFFSSSMSFVDRPGDVAEYEYRFKVERTTGSTTLTLGEWSYVNYKCYNNSSFVNNKTLWGV